MYLCKCCNDTNLESRPNGVYHGLYCKNTGRFQKYSSSSEIKQYQMRTKATKRPLIVEINSQELNILKQQYNMQHMGEDIYFNHDLMKTYKLVD